MHWRPDRDDKQNREIDTDSGDGHTRIEALAREASRPLEWLRGTPEAITPGSVRSNWDHCANCSVEVINEIGGQKVWSRAQ